MMIFNDIILDGITEELSYGLQNFKEEREREMSFQKNKQWDSAKFSNQECKEDLSKEIKKDDSEVGRKQEYVGTSNFIS